MKWAILSGIEGNLAAYEAVMADIKRQSRDIEALYILGDAIEPTPTSTRETGGSACVSHSLG